MSRTTTVALSTALATAGAVGAATSCGDAPVTTPHHDAGVHPDAGSDGAAGDASADAPTDTGSPEAGPCDAGAGDWMSDECLWIPEPEAADCEVYRAKLPSALIPARVWTACGTGCTVAATPLSDLPYSAGAVATEQGGEIYYRTSFASQTNVFDLVQRLSDNSPIALFRSKNGQPGACVPISYFDTPPLFGTFKPAAAINDPDGPLHFAVTSHVIGAPAAWVAIPPEESPKLGMTLFAFDDGFGLIDSNSLVKAWLTPGSSTSTQLYVGQSYQLAPVGRGSLVAWVDWDGHSAQKRAHIRSWTKTGGTQILVDGVPEYDVMDVALSDAKIVWVGGSGPDSVEGNTGTAALYWSPFSASPTGVVRHTGTATLPHTETATGALVTYGDLAATTVAYLGDGGVPIVHVVVANLITGQLWEIPGRSAGRFGSVMAMNATTLLVSETTAPAFSPVRILRFDLAQLDALTQGLQ